MELDNNESTEQKRNGRGGARPGSGPKPKAKPPTPKHYVRMAENLWKYVERSAVNAGGDAWKARDDERAAITGNLAEILWRMELDWVDNPYAMLTLSLGIYTFGAGRANVKDITAAIKSKLTGDDTGGESDEQTGD